MWDIPFCLRNYPGGVEAIVEEIAPHVGRGLVQEAVDTLGEKFATVDSIGPKFVAGFDGPEGAEERAFVMRDPFERVQYVVTKLRSRCAAIYEVPRISECLLPRRRPNAFSVRLTTRRRAL